MKKLYIQINSSLNTLQEDKFKGEPELQELLEHFPELIPSDEIIGNPSFFLIQREFPVSTGYVDHLFIDQMMIPTIVETKVNNPEIRRKIIGQGYEYLTSLSTELTGKQIIEYAKKYWKDQYSSELKKRLELRGLDAKEIDKNLKKPRLRLIFAADFIPRELRKFVEFINNASRGIDVYAIQIERYILDDKKIISVSTWGPTESVIHDKSILFGILSKEEFINKINQSQDLTPSEKETFVKRVNEVLDTSEEKGLQIGWETKSFNISFQKKDKRIKLLEFQYKGNPFIDFIPISERDEFITKTYEKLDEIFDVQKKYLNPTAQFKMGLRNLYQLSNDQYKQLLDILSSLAAK